KLMEITGSSQTSMEDAIRLAVSRAAKTVHNLRWFEVLETRGHIEDQQIQYWQVTLKVGFTLDDTTS
ncbi:MAG TPA: dodecin, partial [Gammaproteobacteria bacterium]|nr:dodecin [Gammaproteobacteria bacterium]